MFDIIIHLYHYLLPSAFHKERASVPVRSTSSPAFAALSKNMSANNETSPLNIAQSSLDKIDMTVVDQQMHIHVVLLKKD